jgi:hypothetical protein
LLVLDCRWRLSTGLAKPPAAIKYQQGDSVSELVSTPGQGGSIPDLPNDTMSGTVASEKDQWVVLAVETPDGVVQSIHGIAMEIVAQGITDSPGPGLGFECFKNDNLVLGGSAEPLDQVGAQAQFPEFSSPLWPFEVFRFEVRTTALFARLQGRVGDDRPWHRLCGDVNSCEHRVGKLLSLFGQQKTASGLQSQAGIEAEGPARGAKRSRFPCLPQEPPTEKPPELVDVQARILQSMDLDPKFPWLLI